MQLDQAIRHHLTVSAISDQAKLLEQLRSEGFQLTLSTLSRRLKRLQVRKQGGVYRTPMPERAIGAVSLRKVAPCLLILKTRPGQAQALAVDLDQAGLPTLGGSVSGYDTIFVAPKEASGLDELEGQVLDYLAGL